MTQPGTNSRNQRIAVKQLPMGDTTTEGSFYATVDGEKVGENGRAFWDTEQAAYDCGFRYLVYELNFGGKSD
jgi:hypothetical protein